MIIILYHFGVTYTKIGTIQRRLAWPLRKDDTQIREAFHIFASPGYSEVFGTMRAPGMVLERCFFFTIIGFVEV